MSFYFKLLLTIILNYLVVVERCSNCIIRNNQVTSDVKSQLY